MKLYASCSMATTHRFEVVITGPQDANFTKPPNMRFVRTNVKPAQALDAAARQCYGDYLVQAVDDIEFSPLAFDLMLDAVKEPKTIATCVYWVHGVNHMISHTENVFGAEGGYPNKATKNPVAPICPMLTAVDWFSEYGTDPRFGAQYNQDDLYFRLLACGWKTVFVDGKVTEASGGSDLWRTKGQNDLTTLRSLWRTPDGEWTTMLRKGAGRYDASTILTHNQGVVW
jgi:hypothetical protein